MHQYTNTQRGWGEMGDKDDDIIVRMDDWQDTEIIVYLYLLLHVKDSVL